MQSGSGQTVFIPTGTSGQLLQAGTNTATFVSTTTIHVNRAVAADTSTNILGGAAGQIHMQSGSGQTVFIPTGTSGQLLQAGTNTATFVSTTTIHVNRAVAADTATNIASGLAGAIPIQSAAGITAFIPIGSPNFVLQSNGTTATWVSTSSLGISGGGATFTGGTVPNAVNITSSTQSTTTATGALQVVGGVGIGGNLALGGAIYANGSIGSNGQVLTSNGAGAISWQTPSGGPGGGAAPIFTFGGTGTPIAGTDVTPWIVVRSGVTSSLLILTAKTAPTADFSVSIYRSADDGSTFPTQIGTVVLGVGDKVTSTSVTTALSIGDILRCDINSVNGAADWNCQLETV